MIYENSKSELDWFRAIREYINALMLWKLIKILTFSMAMIQFRTFLAIFVKK